MRAILVDWLVDVAEEFHCRELTLFLCVNYIDRYLSKMEKTLARGKLQLLGITCLLLASKYEEIYVPTLNDLVYISDNTYKREAILGMELSILNMLKFDMAVWTVKHFLDYLQRSLEIEMSITGAPNHLVIENTSNYLTELTLIEYRFLKYLPSLIAASSLYLSCCAVGKRWVIHKRKLLIVY